MKLLSSYRVLYSIILFFILPETLLIITGDDPMTDLRGSGMFGLLQMLYFVRFHQELALKIFQFSRSRDTKVYEQW